MNYGIVLVLSFFLIGNVHAMDEGDLESTDLEHPLDNSDDAGGDIHNDEQLGAEDASHYADEVHDEGEATMPSGIEADMPQAERHEEPAHEETATESVATTPQYSTAHTMPSAPEEQQEQIPEAGEVLEPEVDEIQGIDTLGLDEPRGNWLFKRIWWERAEGRYDKIRQVVDQMNDSRITFFAKRTELDKDVFAPFYLDIGFKQGELQGMLSELLARLEKERQEEGMLSGQEQDLLSAVQEERELLQKLYRDSTNVLLLEEAADKVIERVMEQKNRVARYEQEAWNYMREIARILSDKQARELYYKMDAAWRNIKSVQSYLEKDLQTYFEQLIADAKAQVAHIKDEVQALKEKGFDLKAQIEKPEAQDELVITEQEEETPVKAHPKKAKGVWGYVQRATKSVGDVLLWVPRRLWRLISSLFGFKK